MSQQDITITEAPQADCSCGPTCGCGCAESGSCTCEKKDATQETKDEAKGGCGCGNCGCGN